MSEKIGLTGEKVVAGNIKDFQQIYQLFYYPKERSLPDKVAFYIYLANNKKLYAKRSIYFSSLEQLKTLAKDIIKAYFYFLDKRVVPDIEVSRYRKLMLEALLQELRREQVNVWSTVK